MEQAIDNACLREFLTSKGLGSEFRAYADEYEKRREREASPAIYMAYEKSFSRNSRDEVVNITPWLRRATEEEASRFMRLVIEETDTYGAEDDEDGRFLSGIAEECLRGEDLEWFHRAHSVRVMLYGMADGIRKALPDVRPADHERMTEIITPAKGPIGPGDNHVDEVVGTLL